MRARTLLAVLALPVLATLAGADVRLPALVSDGMVLQRDTQASIWGWARPGEEVSVSASWGGSGRVTTSADGSWRVWLDTPDAGGPYSITIAGDTTSVVDDVLVGEVWVLSGQSNMEWPLNRSEGAEEELKRADVPAIRLFDVPNTFAAHPRSETSGTWQHCTPETAGRFSGVGYFFARAVQDKLNVPIGLIEADWGGTRVEAWMSREAAESLGDLGDQLDVLDAMGDPARRDRFREEMESRYWSQIDRRAGVPDAWTRAGFKGDGWRDAVGTGDISQWGLGGFDGFVYVRCEADVPADLAGKAATLRFGPIDDQDDTWVNGTLVGTTHGQGRWNQPREYAIPEGTLKAGVNCIAVRMLDTGGIGGFGTGGRAMQLIVGDRSMELDGWVFKQGLSTDKLPPAPDATPLNANTITALSNAMIEPIVNMTIRGALWYQGEANVPTADQYERRFTTMIQDWRRRWGIGHFPFYFVQLAPFRYGNNRAGCPGVRDAQRRALSLPNTGMAVTMDVGNPRDIHPTDKEAVGKRLALWALTETYGEDVGPYSGPLYTSHAREGASIRVSFDHAAGWLVALNGELPNWLIAGADRVWHRADVEIDGDEAIVSCPDVPEPVAVRYAWSDECEPNLFNKHGLPASPFRTDDWDLDPGPIDNDAEMRHYRTEEPGFVALFNGRDLSGWHNVNCAPSTWTVDGGVIKCTGKPTGVLRTDRMYENYIVELEWRHMVPNGNAGLFIWSDALTAKGQPFTRSVEVQVMDGQESDWYTSDGDIFPIHGSTMKPVNGRGGSRAFPTERRTRRSPEWNHYRVTCNKGEVTLAINGKVVTRGTDCSPRMGYICLESEGTPVEFRNIRIKELPDSGNLRPEQICEEAQGFKPLYDGVDLQGWEVETGSWQAADWRLACTGPGRLAWSGTPPEFYEFVCDFRWTAAATDESASAGIGVSQETVFLPDTPVNEWNRVCLRRARDGVKMVMNGSTPLEGLHTRTGPPWTGLNVVGGSIEFANIYIRELR